MVDLGPLGPTLQCADGAPHDTHTWVASGTWWCPGVQCTHPAYDMRPGGLSSTHAIEFFCTTCGDVCKPSGSSIDAVRWLLAEAQWLAGWYRDTALMYYETLMDEHETYLTENPVNPPWMPAWIAEHCAVPGHWRVRP